MTAMPVLGAARAIVVPEVVERTVGDTTVLAARLPTVPLVHVRARLGTDGGVGSALLAASLLDVLVGTDTLRTSLEQLGATAEVSADPDGIVLTLAAQADVATALVSLIGGIPAATAPDDRVLAAERARLAALTQMTSSDAGEAARRGALATAYGTHAYAETLPTADQLDGVQLDEVAHVLSGSALTSLVVVGDIEPAALAAAGIARFGARADSSVAAPLPSLGSGTLWVDRAGSVQVVLRSVAPAPRLGDPDRAAVEVLDMLVGNGWCSAFHRVLREKHGYGYHPSSSIVDRSLGAQFEMSVDVASEVTGAALAVVEEELGRLVESPVDEDWLEVARRGALGALARRLDSQAYLAELLEQLSAAGLSPAYVSEHARALREVTATDLQAVARRLLPLEGMSVVLVGDRRTLSGQPRSRLLDLARAQ